MLQNINTAVKKTLVLILLGQPGTEVSFKVLEPILLKFLNSEVSAWTSFANLFSEKKLSGPRLNKTWLTLTDTGFKKLNSAEQQKDLNGNLHLKKREPISS